MHRKVPAWFGPGVAGKGLCPAQHLASGLPVFADPAFLLVAWDRVRGNKGARTAGVDGETAHYIESERGVEGFLAELRADLRARSASWREMNPVSS